MPQSCRRPLASAITLALVMSACGGDGGGNVIAPDGTAPTVTITQPAPGPVSGSVTTAADASDNVAVTGVRFLIDGVVLGPDDTEAPYQQTWDASQATEGEVQLTAIARDAAGNEATSPVVTVSVTPAPTPQGLILLNGYNQGNSQIVQIAPDGSNLQVLVDNANSPAWTADRSRLAFAMETEVFIAAGDGSSPHQVTQTPEVEEHLRWSPDGTRLLYSRSRNGLGELDVFVMNADGSGQRPLFPAAATREFPAWSPDGRRIAYATGPSNRLNIWTANADGTGAAQLTHGGYDASPAWSPDGSRIAYRHSDLTGEETQQEIYVIGVDGGSPTNITANPGQDSDPEWSPDGEWIAFATLRNTLDGRSFGIWIMRPDGSLPQPVTGSAFDAVAEPSWR